jgi:hypothetical protein
MPLTGLLPTKFVYFFGFLLCRSHLVVVERPSQPNFPNMPLLLQLFLLVVQVFLKHCHQKSRPINRQAELFFLPSLVRNLCCHFANAVLKSILEYHLLSSTGFH